MSGKHSKKKEPARRAVKLAAAAAVAAGAVAPLSATGSASAASVSDWDKIAQCESGGDWAINHSSDGLSVGGLQFQNPSWHDALAYLRAHGYDTSGWTQTLYQGMPRSAVPTKEQTILAGEALLALQGPGAWVCNSLVGSPLKSSGAHGSMFKGGIDPTGGSAPAADPQPAPAPDPVPAADPADNPPAADPQPDPAPSEQQHYRGRHARHGGGQYTVQPGDCLSKIAGRHGGDWRALYAKNRGSVGGDPDVIRPGQVLSL